MKARCQITWVSNMNNLIECNVILSLSKTCTVEFQTTGKYIHIFGPDTNIMNTLEYISEIQVHNINLTRDENPLILTQMNNVIIWNNHTITILSRGLWLMFLIYFAMLNQNEDRLHKTHHLPENKIFRRFPLSFR